MLVLFFLSSGLLLGWSLGANHAANVFGTAVGSRMVRFGTAALICSVFVIIGSVVGGAGAAGTLGQLGAVDALGGAFMVALAAAVTITVMTRWGLPASTSQAVVGAIIGWNVFSGVPTDVSALTKIVAAWVVCPVLAGVFAVGFYLLHRRLARRLRPHLLWDDMATRWALIAVGAFGSYSLGANNIGNVMGVFVPVAPFPGLELPFGLSFSGAQQLFLLGGLAIALGVFTYSHRVMSTVGGDLFKLTPQMALVVVLSLSVVLFLFSSQDLERLLRNAGLPTLPLVPISSSQAVIGAVVGLGLLKGGRGIRYRVLVDIAVGWVTTPLIAGFLAFVGLFFLQNVFSVPVNRAHGADPSPAAIERPVNAAATTVACAPSTPP
ncbi:MAG: inorganic phosphate transporter [bacterium]|nr:inorganic phosphate transporter [bacterium]